jgi:4a-hydroxytetrahydrobiopterin dehydratase
MSLRSNGSLPTAGLAATLFGKNPLSRLGIEKEFAMHAVHAIPPPMPRLYDSKEIKEAIKDLPAWEVEGKNIERTFEFEDFAQAIDFVNGIAELAEEADHHPDFDVRYNKVRVVLSTHSKGGLTDMDFDLAEKIDTLVDD